MPVTITLELREVVESRLRLIGEAVAFVERKLPKTADYLTLLREVNEYAQRGKSHPTIQQATLERLRLRAKLDGERADAEDKLKRSLPACWTQEERQIYESLTADMFARSLEHCERLEVARDFRELSVHLIHGTHAMAHAIGSYTPRLERLAAHIFALESIARDVRQHQTASVAERVRHAFKKAS